MHIDHLTALGNSNLVICAIFAGDGSLTYGNDLYKRLFKGTIGEHYNKFASPKDHARIVETCRQARQNPGQLFTCSITAITTGHIWSVFMFEMFVRDDGTIGVVAVKLPDDILEESADADSLRAQLREIAFIQSHEFRPPVARILGLSSMIADSNDIAEIKSYALLMRSSAEELDRHVAAIVKRTNPKSNG